MTDKLASYEKLRVVGQGSYGEVWLVKNKEDKKQVRQLHYSMTTSNACCRKY